MSSRMQVTHHYDADVATVYALVTDPAFLERKYADQGATDVSVERSDDGGGCRVVTRRRVTVDLPGFAKRVMQPTNTVVHTERWAAADAHGRRICHYTVVVQGVPSRIEGTVTLAPNGTGTVEEVLAEVTVSVPLVGGRLERFAVDSAVTVLDVEAAFTARDLAGG